MNKTYLGLGALVILLVIVFIWMRSSSELVGKDVRLALFNTGETKKGLLYVPFTQDVEKSMILSAYLDQDGDGTFAESEKIASDISVRPKEKMASGIPVALASVPVQDASVKIVFAGGDTEGYVRKVTEIIQEKKDLLELHKVTDAENAMKGWGASIAFAQENPPTEAGRIAPDIGQEIAECAPTSAANSLISLAEEHGEEGKLSADKDLINELKGDMDWTPENGVLPDDFVAGKNKWAARYGLPIRTEKVGDQHGRNTIENILDAMAAGGAAEMRIKFRNAAGRADGGHMVTVTGVRVEGDQTFIDVSDPRTPEGTESYEVNGNTIEGYPYEGTALVSWGFVQRWETTPTGTALDPMTSEEIIGIQNAVGIKEKIKVIIVAGHKVPLSQVHIGKGDHCDGPQQQWAHYHSNSGSVTALDGAVLRDNDGCGYGKVKDVPVEDVELP